MCVLSSHCSPRRVPTDVYVIAILSDPNPRTDGKSKKFPEFRISSDIQALGYLYLHHFSQH